MSATSRRTSPAGVGEAAAVWSVLVLVGLVLVGTWVPVQLGVVLGDPAAAPGNPFTLFFGLVRGDVAWTGRATVVLVVLVAALLATGAVAGVVVRRRTRARRRVDRAAGHMGAGAGVAALTARQATATARRLGVPDGAPAGLMVGRSVRGDVALVQDWEAGSVDVWGPRAGKTSARAIPAVLAAPGAVVATSNKRDLVDATRDVRSAAGGPVWVFDPQAIVGERPSWWWNPLGHVTDESRARQLAQVFAHSTRDRSARTDAYFDAAAVDLLAGLLLAAAVAGRPLTQVYLWLADPNDGEPARILEDTGHDLIAAGVRGVVAAPDKQRAGVYGTAQQVASFMTNPAAMRWVTPHAGPEFRPEEFVRGAGTLYSLSREGRGNTAPLVTALTVAVCEAAEEYATGLPHGRLSRPLVAVLDEAANVCRWHELPTLYSHYGSRGIALLTFLQSWSQGVEVWGRDGMRKLWSAATVKVYGGGVSEVEFLEELSRLVGEYQRREASVTHQSKGGGRSTSHQHRAERILDVADLGALDRGRAVVFAAGAVPTLARTQPWWETDRAAAVEASIAAHNPASAAEVPR